MSVVEKCALGLVLLFLAVACATLLRKPLKMVLRVALNSALGFGALWLLNATAAVTGKTVRSLAKFDEINRLTAPKTTAETSKTSSARSSGKKSAGKTKKEEGPTVWQQALDALRGAWASFWDYLQRYYAPAIAAWRAACVSCPVAAAAA